MKILFQRLKYSCKFLEDFKIFTHNFNIPVVNPLIINKTNTCEATVDEIHPPRWTTLQDSIWENISSP